MCIKIVKTKEEIPYDARKPLEDQLKGSKQIVINYEPKDPAIDKFLDEIERLCKNGISAKMNIQFNHNNHLSGAKAKRQAISINKELEVNEVIKMITLIQHSTDKKLEEMIDMCLKR